jgi:hypothetical protein
VGGSDRLLDAPALRDWAHTAVSDLITHIDEINRLNVFPVADSDTGANMLFTMRSALAEANVWIGADGGPRCVARVASALSVGALNGARGNSGVILSQILRGIADVTAPAAADCGGELPHLDAVLLGAALQRGVELVITSMGGQPPTPSTSARPTDWPRRSPQPATRRSSRWKRPPSSWMCLPTPVPWMPAAGACWSCWTRWARRSADKRPPAPSTSSRRAHSRRPALPNGRRHSSR